MGGAGSSAVQRPVVAHLFVADLASPVVEPQDRHHLERVLRVREGELVTVSDGRGGLRTCVFGRSGDLDPVGEVSVSPAPEPPLTIGFALVKGERPEWIVQKLTECGIDRIVPFVAQRSVVRWDGERAARNTVRLNRVAREAAMQSRRSWLPVLQAPADFSSVVDSAGSAVAVADLDGQPVSLSHPVVLVGPEGGWTAEEREKVQVRVGLGPHVLRSETAAVAAAVLLAALRSGVVRSHS